VYQLYLAPVAFDLHALGADVGLDPSGNLLVGDGAGNCPPWQARIRRTLHWLPLVAGWDYTVDPAVNNNPNAADPDYRPQFLSPLVWLWDVLNGGFVPAEQNHVAVGIPRNGLGIRLHARPPHLLASQVGTWGDKAGQIQSRTAARFRWDATAATVAFELDSRIKLEYSVPGSDVTDGTEEIFISDAEMWLLAKGTALQIDDDDVTTLDSSGDAVRILRDDRPRLAMVMAGAIARYCSRRTRAEVTAQGLCPWGGFVGQILGVVSTGSDIEAVDAPITRVEWTGGKNPRTVISTGYAGVHEMTKSE
jgi:hypothetical protein